jgi:hypothetical protein
MVDAQIRIEESVLIWLVILGGPLVVAVQESKTRIFFFIVVQRRGVHISNPHWPLNTNQPNVYSIFYKNWSHAPAIYFIILLILLFSRTKQLYVLSINIAVWFLKTINIAVWFLKTINIAVWFLKQLYLMWFRGDINLQSTNFNIYMTYAIRTFKLPVKNWQARFVLHDRLWHINVYLPTSNCHNTACFEYVHIIYVANLTVCMKWLENQSFCLYH